MDVVVKEGVKEGAPDEYVVEAVISKKMIEGKLHYLIKWQGWPLAESTWEPVENCAKCENLIQEYEREQQREADASAREVKTDESSSSSGPEIISDYEVKRKSRVKKKKRGQRRKSFRSKTDFLVDDDEDDSDLEKKKKSKKRKIKKGNRESGYLSTDYLNGESTNTLDSDSSSSKSKKSKEPKESVGPPKEKKTRLTRENEAIKQYLGTSGVSRVRSREASSTVTSENIQLKKIVPSTCAKESETKPVDSETKPADSLLNLKHKRRISSSSSSSEAENYERQYFGWEKGKKIVEIIDWYGYQDKVIHLVKYHDGELEYVSDSYTCKRYPWEVFEMYNKQTNGDLDEDQKVWLSYAIQRFQEIEKNGPYEETSQIRITESDEESVNNDSGQEDVSGVGKESKEVNGGNVEDLEDGEDGEDSAIVDTNMEKREELNSGEEEEEEASGQSEYGDSENQNQLNSDEVNFERDGEETLQVEEEEEEEVENDENNQNYHNSDSTSSSCDSNRERNAPEETVDSSVLVVNTTMDESLGQNDSVFIVQSDLSLTQTIPTNQPIDNPEFVIEDSDIEDDLYSYSSVK